MTYSIQEIRGAVARGWCADANRKKEMDSDLAEAISQEIWQMLASPPAPVLTDSSKEANTWPTDGPGGLE